MIWITTSNRAQLVAAAVGVATAVNLVVYGLGHLAGATYEFTGSGQPATVTAGTVAGFTAVPLGVGLLLATVLGHRWPRLITIAQVAVPVLAIGTILVMTLPVDLDTPSTIALAACHLTLIPPARLVLSELRRRTPTTTDRPSPTEPARR